MFGWRRDRELESTRPHAHDQHGHHGELRARLANESAGDHATAVEPDAGRRCEHVAFVRADGRRAVLVSVAVE